MLPAEVVRYLQQQGHGAVVSARPVGGGCINNGVLLKTEAGQTFFLKTNAAAPADMFAREAEGLAALARAGGPRVPRVYLVGRDFLLLEDLAPQGRRADFWELLGRQLAALHNCTAERFGFAHDNYIGSTPQPNPWTEDGYDFFAEHRLLYQARLGRERGLLSSTDLRRVERLCGRLRELVPPQPASLIHGDLWSGNVISDAEGNPALIDPAAHYGWAEAELAMTALFGGFPQAFYRAYAEARPLEAGYRRRFPVYNLYHLLNHLNLFGRGYLGQVQAVLRMLE
ncbi:MAG: ketosamine-3-kinase [Anaerolineae bacterium]|nr:MAG: ketosamine-3-kinase [Anaerolineae bacterium]